MVGGAVIDKLPGGLEEPENPPKMHAFTYILTSMAAIGGFLFGYDTGIISAAMLYLQNNEDIQPISNIWKELIVSVTPAFAGVGAVLAAPAADRWGRKPVIMSSCIVFIIGAIICAAAVNKEILLVGRVLLGVAIGFASMIVPVYLSESAPTNIRGLALTCFNIMLTLGLMFANVIGGLFAFVDPENIGWRLMFGFAAVPAIIQLIGFLFLPESPRWLFRHKGEDATQHVLHKIYNGDEEWISFENAAIHAMVQSEILAHENSDHKNALLRILKTPHVRKSLLIGCSLQMFQQLAGINTIMYYTGEIIKSAGIKSNHTVIWLSAAVASFNVFGTLVPFFLIERIGRRKILLASTFGTVISLVLLGGSFLLLNKDTAHIIPKSDFNFEVNSVEHYEHCVALSNCDYCVTDGACGFCTSDEDDNHVAGYCLPSSFTTPDKFSEVGPCAKGFSSAALNETFTWQDSYCNTKFTIAPIILMVVYLFVFSCGLISAPWVLNAEFYPLWARSTCVATATATNWAFNVVISMTFLTLSETITKFGTFFLYAALTVLALIVFIIWVPETMNCNLNEIEALFMTKKSRAAYVAHREAAIAASPFPNPVASKEEQF
uniref:MFS domain-containing protein n=1 Tax=Panagrellus redivivus TaxID=6233 RepID=A0A7E4VX81_PANRE